MANLTVRDIDADTHAAFKKLAKSQGRSMEALLRHMIGEAVNPSEKKLGDLHGRIQAHMEKAGGGLRDGELIIPPREKIKAPVTFD